MRFGITSTTLFILSSVSLVASATPVPLSRIDIPKYAVEQTRPCDGTSCPGSSQLIDTPRGNNGATNDSDVVVSIHTTSSDIESPCGESCKGDWEETEHGWQRFLRSVMLGSTEALDWVSTPLRPVMRRLVKKTLTDSELEKILLENEGADLFL